MLVAIIFFLHTFLLCFSSLSAEIGDDLNLAIFSKKKYRRIKNEDRVRAVKISNDKLVLLLLDGHGGIKIVEQAFSYLLSKARDKSSTITYDNAEQKLHQMFVDCAIEGYSTVKGFSGATASLVYIDRSNDTQWFAWANIGDSPIVLGSKNETNAYIFEKISKTHRLDSEGEKEWERIQNVLRAPPSELALKEKWIDKNLREEHRNTQQRLRKRSKRKKRTKRESIKKRKISRFLNFDSNENIENNENQGSSNVNRQNSFFRVADFQNNETQQSTSNMSRSDTGKEPLELSILSNIDEWSLESDINITRAFGNLSNQRLGVTPKPSTGKRVISSHDKFITIFSDGISDPFEDKDQDYVQEIGHIITEAMNDNLDTSGIVDSIVNASLLMQRPQRCQEEQTPNWQWAKDDMSIVLFFFTP